MYYLWLDNAQAGPFTLAQIAEQWRTGRVTDLTLYWEEGNADWLPLHNIAGLLGSPAAPTAPTLPKVPVVPSTPSLPPRPAPEPAVAAGEEVVWSGHPSLWSWTVSIFWGVLLTPVLIGIIILIHVFWSRASARYQVTTRRVSLETGLFTRSSRELRIEDIRSIAARANVFGIGDIEFSTAARAEAEVSFQGLSHVERVRDLVKDLQNRTRV
jgi:membrane protein YdbS with pleckstrin-like domain